MTLNVGNIKVTLAPDGVNGGPARQLQDDEIIEKANRVNYLDNNFFIPEVIEMLSEGEYKQIDLFPEYQRRLVWTVDQQSALIESILLGIPIPSVFMFKKGSKDYEVIDGLQRLNSIRGFRNDEFKLSGLRVLRSLEGFSFSNCNIAIQERFDGAVLPAKILTMGRINGNGLVGDFVESDIRRFIFSRINRGGTRLNSQQLRNAVYKNDFNSAINELSKTAEFRQAFDIPQNIDEPSNRLVKMTQGNSGLYYDMKDCELILRFFALRGDHKTGSLEEILDYTMERENEIDIKRANELKVEFLERLRFLMELFDGRPFDTLSVDRVERNILFDLYEGFMLGIDYIWEERDEVMQRKAEINEAKYKDVIFVDQLTESRDRDSTDDYIVPRGGLASQILMAGK